MRILFGTACLLGILGLAACAVHRPAPGTGRRELAARVRGAGRLAVLFVGNSYSFGVPREFAKVAAEHGKSVRTGHSTHGGWTLARHAAHPPTLRKIREGGWDIVVFQEFSETPALPPRRAGRRMLPPLRKLVAAARAAGAVPVLYQTWGRRDGDPARRGDDFRAMNGRVRASYHHVAAELGGLVLVPAGDAWEREFTTGRGAELFQADGSHPSARGNRITAEVFYQTLFRGD